MGEDTRTEEEFLADLAVRRAAYLEWRDNLLANVREAINEALRRPRVDFNQEALNLHELNRNVFERVALVLTAESDARDDDGRLIAVPGSRWMCRWLVVQLAMTYGIEVPDRP